MGALHKIAPAPAASSICHAYWEAHCELLRAKAAYEAALENEAKLRAALLEREWEGL